jgi:signal peptidase I
MRKIKSRFLWKIVSRWVSLVLTGAVALGASVYFMGTKGYFVPSDSMEPTLLRGDRFRADLLFSPKHGPGRGEVWVFRNPQPMDGNGEILVKRVVGLPGQTVAMHGGRLKINGEVVAEPYVRERARYTLKPRKLGAEEYWLLGDNRNNSEDSHAWGPLNRRALIGRVFVRYWPLGRFQWW